MRSVLPTQWLLPARRDCAHVLKGDRPAEPIRFGNEALRPFARDAVRRAFGGEPPGRVRERRITKHRADVADESVWREQLAATGKVRQERQQVDIKAVFEGGDRVAPSGPLD